MRETFPSLGPAKPGVGKFRSTKRWAARLWERVFMKDFNSAAWAKAAFIALCLVLPAAAHAATVQGAYLGTFSGNDSEAQLFADTGYQVTELAKIDTPETVASSSLSNDGLTISNLVLNGDNEAISGDWTYDGPDIADIIVIKAGDMYAAYLYADGNDGGMPNMGIWDTGDVDNKGLSHITAYRIVPIPAAAWLFVTALLGLVGLRRR